MVSFLKTLTREIINTILLILGVTALLFFLFNIMPGVFPGKGQGFGGYVDLLKRLFTFNFGTSFVSGRDINSIIFPAFRNTLVLTAGSIVLSMLISVPIGIFSAYRGFKSYSWPLSVFSYIMSSIPVFYLGYLVLYIVSRQTGFLPIYYPQGSGRGSPFLSYVLPILVLGLGNDSISEIVRLITNELGRVMDSDYVIASKARGESVLKSSINEGIVVPLVSITFSKIPFIIGGAVIVEHVFNWPGMGRLAFQSTLNRDLPMLIVIAFLSVLIVRAGMIIKELVLYYFNPRES
ncbi:MAG TPA: ABC transporter permease [Spirochaetes bacterium]|nr:ABC transporter permease [Spirochaetota bacterium]